MAELPRLFLCPRCKVPIVHLKHNQCHLCKVNLYASVEEVTNRKEKGFVWLDGKWVPVFNLNKNIDGLWLETQGEPE